MLTMPRLRRPYRRLLILVLALPVTLFVLAVLYQTGMRHFEGEPRSPDRQPRVGRGDLDHHRLWG